MKKLAICALALGGLTASAQAVMALASEAYAADLDLGSLKDPLPDAPLTWRGITLYGAIDVGVAYQSHGAPASGALATGLEYQAAGANNLRVNNLWAVAPNGLSQSFVGLKMEEALGGGWTAIGKIETGFVPTSGELADGCASIARNNGQTNATSGAFGDSSRCGQGVNGPAYIGVSNAAYGTLTFGRQNSLMLDANANYDPQQLSYAFSVLGYYGGTEGTGDTETARWDNSVKYVYQYGPFHAAAMYTEGGPDTGFHGPAYGLNAGVTWRGFSVDTVYDRAKGVDAVAAPMSLTQCGLAGFTTQSACASAKVLAASIADTEAWGVMGKYTYEFGGGYKDMGPAAKLTFYGGYERITFSDPSSGTPPGYTTIGGYVLGFTNNLAFMSQKDLDVFWVGATYETGPWRFTGAYYGERQNSWLTSGTIAAGNPGAGLPNGTPTACNRHSGGTTESSNCSGGFDEVSFVVDYTVTKHFDVYAGVNYGVLNGGFASGFLQDNTTTVMTGMRLKF